MTTDLFAHKSLILALFAAGLGLAVALVTWLLGRILAEVPDEDRAYKDAPPLGFRLLWWPIHWCSHFVGPLVPGKMYNRLFAALRKAGLDYAINPAQFVAARLVGSVLMVGIFWWAVGSFDTAKEHGHGFATTVYLQAAAVGMLLGWIYPAIWLRDRLALRKRELLKMLPFYLDLVTLCVEAGLNMQGAMQQAVAKGPKGVLRDEFQRVLRDVRAGRSRAESLRLMAERLNEISVTGFTTAVIQAERMGMNLGPVLRAQADQRRTERFLRAEKLAMEAPVKMLFPLIAFIFPCTFIVLFFPIVMKFMQSGI